MFSYNCTTMPDEKKQNKTKQSNVFPVFELARFDSNNSSVILFLMFGSLLMSAVS